ncbi:unnamed protein product [Ophioblennius macclurei]
MMQMKAVAFILILILQACGPLSAQTMAPAELEPQGFLQRLTESARNAKANIQHYGKLARGFADTYYEDHIQPVAGSYVDWASEVKKSMWERLQTTIDNYTPSILK